MLPASALFGGGNMSWEKRLRLIVDIVMTVSMPVLMAYELAGSALHEYLGVIVFILFICHHILNRGWIKGIAKGRYSAVRLINLTVNLLLLIVMFLLPVSGIMMSKHIFMFLDFHSGMAFARTAHLLASYWGFLLMSLHLGMHWNAIRNAAAGKNTKAVSKISKSLPSIAVAAVSIYGICAFLRRGIAGYLFLKNQFVFFDFSEPVPFFLLDYFTIMVMAACIGYYFMLALRKLSRKNSRFRAAERQKSK